MNPVYFDHGLYLELLYVESRRLQIALFRYLFQSQLLLLSMILDSNQLSIEGLVGSPTPTPTTPGTSSFADPSTCLGYRLSAIAFRAFENSGFWALVDPYSVNKSEISFLSR